ncbi:hypothetical protein [Leifsonia sp. NPDC058230]|uniref:hypothetical protein n=1 Tax=Leifsonia sp. NPDC058230 TaxID=3346391 RepID=UPI0036D7A7A5
MSNINEPRVIASRKPLAPSVMAAVIVVSIAAAIILMLAGMLFYSALGLLGESGPADAWGTGALVIASVLLAIAVLTLLGLFGLIRDGDYGRLLLTFTGGLGLIATIALLATFSFDAFRGASMARFGLLASVLLIVGTVLAWIPMPRGSRWAVSSSQG